MPRTVVVTGVSRGLGREVAATFSAAGWHVVGVSRSPLEAAGERLHPVLGDVAEPPTSAALLAAVGSGSVDVLVNNAVAGSNQHRLADVDPDDFARSLAVNVVAPLRLSQALLPALLRSDRPLILNVSSRLGSLTLQARGDFRQRGTSYAYRVSKAALNMLTVSLADELGERVRCWAVHPGVLATPDGRPGATRTPGEAAAALLDLVETDDPRPLRFCSLGEDDLPW